MVQLLVGAEGYGHQLHSVDLGVDSDPIILLDSLTCLEIELVGMDEIPTVPWMWDLELRLDDVRVQADSTLVVTQDGVPRGRAYIRGSGPLLVRFPPLSSHGSLRPLELELAPGEHRRIVLGPDALATLD